MSTQVSKDQTVGQNDAALVEKTELLRHLDACATLSDILTGGKDNSDIVSCYSLLGVLLAMTLTDDGVKGKDRTTDAVVRTTLRMDEDEATRLVKRAFKIRDELSHLIGSKIQPVIQGPEGPTRPDAIGQRFIAEFLLPASKAGNKVGWQTAMASNKAKRDAIRLESAKATAATKA